MDDKFLDIILLITLTISVIVAILIAINLIMNIFQSNKNCHYEMYMQYPCEGATHYARVHRNYDEACERYKRICDEVQTNEK